MPDLKTVNSRSKTCLRCRGMFQVVRPKNSSTKEKIAKLDFWQGIQFIKLIRQDITCDLKDAWRTFMHYVRQAETCHWCGSEIEIAEFVDYPKCKSLNIYPLAAND